MKDVS